MNSILSVLAVTLATWVLTPCAIAILRRLRIMDHPNERSSHHSVTVRGAGVAPWLVSSLVAMIVFNGGMSFGLLILLSAASFGALGLFEDVQGMSPLGRLVWQALIAVAVIAALLSRLPEFSLTALLFLALGALWIVGYVNAFNFMDGINGMSVGQATVAAMALCVVASHVGESDIIVSSALLAAAALGFLPWNFPQARAFLGDVGSYFFGSWLAVTVVVLITSGAPWVPTLSPLLLYLADTGLTLFRRILRGDQWHAPHRDHIYQQLHQLGYSHAQVTTLATAIMLLLSVTGLGLLQATGTFRVVLLSFLLSLLAFYLASPMVLRRVGSKAVTRLP